MTIACGAPLLDPQVRNFRKSRTKTMATVVAATTLLLSGCASTNGPEAAPETTPAAPCTAAPAPTGEDRFGDSALAEGSRMAEVLALPTDIDPGYIHHSSSGVLTGSRLMVVAGHNNEVSNAAENHGLLAGFVTQRYSGDARTRESRWLTHGIMRFRDPVSACAAAKDLSAAAERSRGMFDTADREAAGLPGESDTQFSLRSQHDRLDGLAITPYREYVVYTEVRHPDRAEIERLTTRALELQRPLLDAFTPTPVHELARLPYDPDGIFALSIGANVTGPGAYRQRGAVIFAEDQLTAARLYPEVGLSAMARKGTVVYRTADHGGATRLSEFLTATIAADDRFAAPAPADLPRIPCFSDGRDHPNAWVCVVPAGRYVALAVGRNQDETHRLAREQHAVLAAAE